MSNIIEDAIVMGKLVMQIKKVHNTTCVRFQIDKTHMNLIDIIDEHYNGIGMNITWKTNDCNDDFAECIIEY
jgi:hypothetical protein